MTKRDEREARPKKGPAPKDAGGAKPPPMAARIADVEPFVAPFEPPPGASKRPDPRPIEQKPAPEAAPIARFEPPAGAMKAPAAPPVWRTDGKSTGQLALPSAPLPKTVELELPAEPSSAIPATRELDAPSAGALLFSETTYILSEAQLRGEEDAPLSAFGDDEERTDRFTIPAELLTMPSDVDTVGDTPSPLFEQDDDPTGPQSLLSIHEETTAILQGRELPPEDDES